MKPLIISFSLLFSAQLSCAQNLSFNWAKQIAGTTEGAGYAITSDALGNVYTTGFFSGTKDFDPGPAVYNFTAAGTGDIFISKLDSSGNFVWAKQMKGTNYGFANAITLDAMGNIYTTGGFTHTVDFDPGPGIFNISVDGRHSAFILKLDNDGNFIWAKKTGGVNVGASNTAFSIAVDLSGNVITTGLFAYMADFDPGPGEFYLYTASTGGDLHVFILKLNSDGNFIWAKQIGGPISKSIGNAVVTDAAGNIYTTGYFSAAINSNTVDFDPGPGMYNLVPVGGEDIFISKLDAAGNFIWARQMGSSLFDEGKSIAMDASGNLYISGYFNATVDFDPGSNVFNLSSFGGKDIFITKLNAAGNFVWARQMGGTALDEAKSISMDAIGNIYVAGYFNETCDFDPGTSVYNLTSAGSYDMFILKLDNNGDFKWAKKIGGAFVDGATAIHVDDARLYATGYFEDIVDFDPGPGVYNLTTAGNKDIFVLKLGLCSNFTFSVINAAVCNIYILNGQSYTTSGTYIQTLNNSAGCDSIITLNLTVNIKYTTINATICQGQSYYAGGASQTTSGIYKDTLLTSLGCDSIITTNLTVNAILNPDLGPDRNLCTNTQATITPGSFNSYLWHDNSSQPNYIVNNPGKYWVTVTDANNCSATDTLNILAIDTIPKNFLPPNHDLCYGNVLRIDVPNYFTYQWSTGAIGDFIVISNSGTYYLTVKDYNACTGTDSITIQRKNCIYIGIPSAFTPNGDTKNDIFKPTIFQAVQNFSFVVFNRYGQKVFETSEYGKGWDGSFKGKIQSSGTYVYHIKYTNVFGVENVENGSVLLIR